MATVDPQDFQERLDRISAIFGEMVTHAEEQSLTRCPYRDRHDLCTALFGCRNQLSEGDAEDLQCGHDGGFDYRDAWESHPRNKERMLDRIAGIRRAATEARRDREPPP